jgi:hypothetical protein
MLAAKEARDKSRHDYDFGNAIGVAVRAAVFVMPPPLDRAAVYATLLVADIATSARYKLQHDAAIAETRAALAAMPSPPSSSAEVAEAVYQWRRDAAARCQPVQIKRVNFYLQKRRTTRSSVPGTGPTQMR